MQSGGWSQCLNVNLFGKAFHKKEGEDDDDEEYGIFLHKKFPQHLRPVVPSI